MLSDGTPPPDLSSGRPVILAYCDNLNVAGMDAHEVSWTNAGTRASSLGYEIDGAAGTMGPQREKLSKVMAAFAWLRRRPRHWAGGGATSRARGAHVDAEARAAFHPAVT